MKVLTPSLIGLMVSIVSGLSSSGGSSFSGGSDRIYYWVNFGGPNIEETRPGLRDSEERWAWIEGLSVWSMQLEYPNFGRDEFYFVKEKVRFRITDVVCNGLNCLTKRSDDLMDLCPHPEHIARAIYSLGQYYGTNKAIEFTAFLKLAEKFLLERHPYEGSSCPELDWVREQSEQFALTEKATEAAQATGASVAVALATAELSKLPSTALETVKAVGLGVSAVRAVTVADELAAASVEATLPATKTINNGPKQTGRDKFERVKDRSTSGRNRAAQPFGQALPMSTFWRINEWIALVVIIGGLIINHRTRLTI